MRKGSNFQIIYGKFKQDYILYFSSYLNFYENNLKQFKFYLPCLNNPT